MSNIAQDGPVVTQYYDDLVKQVYDTIAGHGPRVIQVPGGQLCAQRVKTKCPLVGTCPAGLLSCSGKKTDRIRIEITLTGDHRYLTVEYDTAGFYPQGQPQAKPVAPDSAKAILDRLVRQSQTKTAPSLQRPLHYNTDALTGLLTMLASFVVDPKTGRLELPPPPKPAEPRHVAARSIRSSGRTAYGSGEDRGSLARSNR